MKNPVLTHESHRERIRRAASTKNWTKGLTGALSFMAFCVCLYAQPSQSGTDRVTFGRSITGVGTEASLTAATIVRSELTQAELQATLGFSVALKIRNFAELQERIGKGEIISIDEIAALTSILGESRRGTVEVATGHGLSYDEYERIARDMI